MRHEEMAFDDIRHDMLRFQEYANFGFEDIFTIKQKKLVQDGVDKSFDMLEMESLIEKGDKPVMPSPQQIKITIDECREVDKREK